MEDRIAELESEVQAFMRRPASMGHPLIRKLLGAASGDSDRIQASASPFLPLYTGEPRDWSAITLGPDGPVFPELILEGYGSVIPRSVPESGLGRLDLDSEVPIELSECL